MNKKKIFGICMVMLLLVMSLSATTFALVSKQENTLFNHYNGMQVDWDHVKNTRDRQEFILTINSATAKTVSPSLILSEYTQGYSQQLLDNIEVYFIQEVVSYEYYTQYCTDHTYTDCSDNMNGSYTINGGNAQREVVDVTETLMPQHGSQIKESTDYFEFDLNDMVLESNKPKKYRVVFARQHQEGDYGIFSVKVEGNEYWDKTHSSDFLVNDILVYYTLDNVLTDSTPSGNDLTNNGATYTASGKINGAYSFDGNDYMFSDNLIEPSQITISTWFKTTSSAVDQSLVVDRSYAYALKLRNGQLNNYIWTSSSNFVSYTGSTAYNDGNWHHYVMTYDGSNMRTYLDGDLKNTQSLSGSIFYSNDGGKTTLGRNGGNAGEYYTGDIDEVGIWSVALNQTGINELYNSGVGKQYPFTSTPEYYNTSLQSEHVELADFSVSSALYSNVYSFNYTVGTNDTDLVMVFPITATKTSGSQANDIYLRTIIDGVPTQDKLIVTLPSNGDSRSAVYNSVAELLIEAGDGFHEIDIEIRRSGNGAVLITDPHLNIYSDLTANGKLNNAYINISTNDIAASGSFVDVMTGALLNESSNNTFLMFVGSIYNSSVDDNDVELRFAGDTFSNGALIRTVDIGETGSVFMTKIIYNADENFSVQAKSPSSFTLDGNFYVVDLLDTDGGIVQTYQNFTTGVQTNELSLDGIRLVNESLITMSSVSFNPTTVGTASYNVNLEDTNTTTFYQSETVSRNFAAGDYGVMGLFHGYQNLNKGNNFDLSTDFNYSGTGTFQYFNILAMQSTDLNLSLDTTGDINLTINEVNGSVVGAITGDCESKNVVNSITINDTDWVFSGDADAFTFTYTGVDVATTTVAVTCTDQYANSETVVRNYVIDSVSPVCTGIQDVFLSIGIGDNSTGYTWDISCSDNIGLSQFDVVCDNGYNDVNVISGPTYNYTKSIVLNETTGCTYTVVDIGNNQNVYSNTFSITQPPTLPERNLTQFDVDAKLYPFQCPTNHMQFGILLVFLVLSILIYWYGYKVLKDYQGVIFCGLAGFMMFALPFYLVACDLFLSMFLWVVSAAMLFGAITKPFKRKGDDEDDD